ncbi:MAG: hypothetical protein FWB83_07575 [Treponema sp.]|nr:hypothetical protein [Treponema sp.]
MKKKLSFTALAFAMVAILAVSALSFSGCDILLIILEEIIENEANGNGTIGNGTNGNGTNGNGTNGNYVEQVQIEFLDLPHFSFPDDLTFPEIMHYGANIGFFPPKARDWIVNTGFSQERMERAYMRNSLLKVWWDDDNNTILFEASYIVAPGYKDAGTRKTWGEGARYRGGSSIFTTYGEYAYYQTLRFKYEYDLYIEYLLENDPVFAEVIDFAKELCDEIEYDWQSYSGYTGYKPITPTPGKRYRVCGGYTNEVFDKALEVNSVQTVQRWRGPDHAWNVLILTDGRTLYFDLTWFDNEHINHDTGIIYQTDNYRWANITFHDHLFRFSNVAYGSPPEFTHNLGYLDNERIR